MEIQHFSHDHSLVLSDEREGCPVPCNVCSHHIMGLTYSCVQCSFALHKWCAEVPQRITVELFDEKHPVTLLPCGPAEGSSKTSAHFTCDMCHQDGFGFVFSCTESDCSFKAHVECGWARWMRAIGFMYEVRGKSCRFDYEWPSPELDRPYTCSACGNPGSGFRLECEQDYNIIIHVQCAKLPQTARHVTHRHLLALTTTADVVEDEQDEFYCDACEEVRNPNCWVYHCAEGCDIRVHVNCANSPEEVQKNWSQRRVQIVRNNPLYEDAWFRDKRRRRQVETKERLYDRETRQKKIEQDYAKAKDTQEKRNEERSSEAKIGLEIQHFDHKHPLTLYDEPFDRLILCGICTTAIFGKSYSCKDCEYFLHKWCANLPPQIQHPLHHEHPLTLVPSNAKWQCNLCESFRGFNMCYSCDDCDFNLEVLCAVLPENLKHKLHEHTLTPVRTTLNDRLFDHLGKRFTKRFGNLPPCDACGFPCEDLSLECAQCDLHLHIHCFLLPGTGKHKAHRHELVLSLSPDHIDSNADLDDFYCDACEEKRNPNNWVYRCAKCDYLFAAHVSCVAAPKLTSSEAMDELQNKYEDDQSQDDNISVVELEDEIEEIDADGTSDTTEKDV